MVEDGADHWMETAVLFITPMFSFLFNFLWKHRWEKRSDPLANKKRMIN